MSNLKKTNSESILINILIQSTQVELASQTSEGIKILVYEMSVGLTVEKAMLAPKIFQLKKSLGAAMLIKLLCVILRSFCDSIKATRSLDTADILECSELLMEKYSHDSVKDIILALKEAKMKGMNFYNVISISTIFEIVNEYIEKKSNFIEKRAADDKSKYDGSVRTEANTRSIEFERHQEKLNRINEDKQLKQIQNERKEIEKLSNFINNNIKKI